MNKPWLALAACLLVVAPAIAGAPDPQELADRIDRQIAARWKADKITPAPLADDAEFLRRVSLDLTGRIPTPREVHDFLADTRADKRRRLIDDSLDSYRHAAHFANVWRAVLLPEAAAGDARYFAPGFEAWLRQRFRDNVGYDRLVRELLTTSLPAPGTPLRSVLGPANQPNSVAFFAAKEGKPENLAAATTRVFLGVQIECAQCHDHPFGRWSKEQFWEQAAFFGGIRREGDGTFAPLTEAADLHKVALPNSKHTAEALFLDGKEPTVTPKQSARAALADWVTAADNPYFARAGANRVWGELFGIGIVDPVDDFNDKNTPSHPELLDDLARAFAESHFDLNYLVRGICLSQTYQRSSARTDASQDDPRTFARMATKGLSGEQFFDSLAQAIGYRAPAEAKDAFQRGPRTARDRFLVEFAPQGRPSEPETSVQQALTLMNGKFLNEAANLETSATLMAVCETPGMTTEERIEALYVAALSRKPSAREREKLAAYVRRGTKDEFARRLGDVFWAVLNSAEFRLNH
jgi:hypothetical protein